MVNCWAKYYLDKKLHREGDLHVIEDIHDNKYWYKEDKRYRDNGLAVEFFNDIKMWY